MSGDKRAPGNYSGTRPSLFAPRPYNAPPTRAGGPAVAMMPRTEGAQMTRLQTRFGDSPKARVGVVLALWAIAVVLGFVAAA